MTTLVTAVAASAGRDLVGCLLVGSAILTGQLSVGWCNDARDAPRDSAVHRREKPIVAGRLGRRTVWIAALVALSACVPFSLASGLVAGSTHLLGVAMAWAYNLWLKSTVLSWVPYAVAFGLLPSFVTLGTPPDRQWAPWWAMTATALLGVGAHLANVVPDIADDLATGVRGLPHRLGGLARAAAVIPLALATVVLVVAPPGAAGFGGWVLLGVVALMLGGLVLWRRGPRRLPFYLTIAIAAVDIALLILRGDTL